MMQVVLIEHSSTLLHSILTISSERGGDSKTGDECKTESSWQRNTTQNIVHSESRVLSDRKHLRIRTGWICEN